MTAPQDPPVPAPAGPLTEEDLRAFTGGDEVRAYRLLGAHVRQEGDVQGTRFAVWAPNATRVAVVGSFNRWDETADPMELVASGVWVRFVPGVGPGALYKFTIEGYGGMRGEKADPYGFAMELRPNTASRVVAPDSYTWGDEAWIAARSATQAHDAPLAVYEVHPGSWRRRGQPTEADPGWLDYDDLADRLIPYVRDMGFTHIELMPVTEHPYDASWGYQPVGYFAATARFGDAEGLRRFVDRAHQAGVGVLLDWVPAHFPRDGHGLVFFDGTHLYEHADPRQGAHPDWGTLIFNYGRPQVCSFLLSSANYWVEEFHIDGIRVDAVASMLYLDYSRKEGEWIPNKYGGRENLEAIEFLKRLNHELHTRHPGVLSVAEESTAWPRVTGPVAEGGLGFDYKWNMGWMHDVLEYFAMDPLFRKGAHDKLTFSLVYAFSERFLLPFSHDEVVHLKGSMWGKMPGDEASRLAHLRLLYAYQTTHPGKTLLFMGSEFGQRGEWNAESELEWGLLEKPGHARLRHLVTWLNTLARTEPALHTWDDHGQGFEWIDCRDAMQSILVFVRWSRDREECVVVVANFTPVPRPGYRIGLPMGGEYNLLLSSDASEFGGGGAELPATLVAEAERWHERDDSVSLDLPALSLLIFKPVR